MDLSYVIPIYIWATEILFFNEWIPEKVSVNEAIEIAKIYWDDSSKKIVNWILNKILVNIEEIKKECLIFDYENNWNLFILKK
jgi:hypothetical protein